MSEEEEFDGEKTQFWLPGQAPPGLPTAGDAQDANLRQSTQPEQRKPALPRDAGAASAGAIDFDLTAGEQPGSTALDFDLSAGANADTMDFDITGEGTIPPQTEAEPALKASPPAAAAPATPKAAPAPAPASSGVSGGTLLLVAIIAIAGVVIYFVTR